MKLNNKTIVLTGASSGVGLHLLRLLAEHNKVICLSRTAPAHDKAHFTHIACDLADSESVKAASAAIKSASAGPIDGLINCAAVQFTPRLVDDDFDPASVASEIAINLTSPIELIAGLLDELQAAARAFILNVNSGLALVPKHESAVYCATKAGLDNFSRGLRAQLADTDVRVQQAFLPIVDTPMTEGRGTGKLTPQAVAERIVTGIKRGEADFDIGKVRLLRMINRISPTLAHRIMQKGD